MYFDIKIRKYQIIKFPNKLSHRNLNYLLFHYLNAIKHNNIKKKNIKYLQTIQENRCNCNLCNNKGKKLKKLIHFRAKIFLIFYSKKKKYMIIIISLI